MEFIQHNCKPSFSFLFSTHNTYVIGRIAFICCPRLPTLTDVRVSNNLFPESSWGVPLPSFVYQRLDPLVETIITLLGDLERKL